MGTDTLTLKELLDSSDEAVVIVINQGEIQVHSSVPSREDFFEVLNIVAEMADEYYPEEKVDNLH